MRKSKLLKGVYGVYAVFDKVSKHYTELYMATTDEEFIRKYLPTVILSTPLRDLQIYKIGTFDDVECKLNPTTKKRISTDCYLFPHSRLSPIGDDLKPEEIEEVVTKTKNEIIAQNADSEESDNNTKKELNENE